jgi:trafficking protein particle complex subunit 10
LFSDTFNATTEKQQEWLIIYVSLGHRRFSELTTKLHRTVYDKIRADFNIKKDRYVIHSLFLAILLWLTLYHDGRCVQLRMLDETKNDEQWDDLCGKLKETIAATVEQYISTYEDEIRKIDSKRLLPGWSYCGFFFLKVWMKENATLTPFTC